jgi:hypothetical protein
MDVPLTKLRMQTQQYKLASWIVLFWPKKDHQALCLFDCL